MPLSDTADNEETTPKTKKPSTPRRAPAVRRAYNATPRKASASKAGTPKSAPAGANQSVKKPQSTALNDFLLGRPSRTRPRRKSAEVAQVEVKKGAVNSLKPPKPINERVKQWQKEASAAVKDGVISEAGTEPEEAFVDVDGQSVTEEDRRRVKFRKPSRSTPDQRKSGDKPVPQSADVEVISPKKRIVSDDHWMVKKDRKTSPATSAGAEHHYSSGTKLPKDFVRLNSLNPPLEKKMSDWKKRFVEDEKPILDDSKARSAADTTKTRCLSSQDAVEERVIRKEDRIFEWAEHVACEDHSGLPMARKGGQQLGDGSGKRGNAGSPVKEYRLPEEYLHLSLGDKREACSGTGKGGHANAESPKMDKTIDIGDHSLHPTPTRLRKTRKGRRSSDSPESLAEIPVGYSAFSVLGGPTDRLAPTSKSPKPHRQSSLSIVPKVLKKVVTEGLKVVHEPVDLPRTGVNQPPSIESWLNGTPDPFVDEDVSSEVIRSTMLLDSTGSTDVRRDGKIPRKKVALTPRTQEASKAKDLADAFNNERYDNRAHSDPDGSDQHGRGGTTSNPGAEPSDLASTLRRSPARRTPVSAQSSLQRSCHVQSDEKLPDRRDWTSEGHASSPSAKTSLERNDKSFEGPATLPEAKTPLSVSPDNRRHGGLPRSPAMYNIAKSTRTHHDSGSPRRGVSAGGNSHRLSTIPSVEMFDAPANLETASELTQTTASRTTTTQQSSITSVTSLRSCVKDRKPSVSQTSIHRSGTKRRLTKHSDLLSVLSLPDASAPGRNRSLVSARSVRTNRTRLENATIPNLLRELCDDETKYKRELKTLVDGVIPVLLNCVLTKSDAAVAAGLFDPTLSGTMDASVTKPIVDMGVALEHLKSTHRAIPMDSAEALVQWALGAYQLYEEYLVAWRMGFQDVIVNLAPATKNELVNDSLSVDEMPVNGNGDVLNENGERVDVAFLLKRPLVRIKYLSKTLKGIAKLISSDRSKKADEKFQDLLAKTRKRMKEEEARLVDQAANNTDATRVRNLRTLAPIEGVQINRARQVKAKDFFDFSLSHSNGQRLSCKVEVLLRDTPDNHTDAGDILICEVDSHDRWLLFPPIDFDGVSARRGSSDNELIVMIRGQEASMEWREVFILHSDDDEALVEWLQMLKSDPVPIEPQTKSVTIQLHSWSESQNKPVEAAKLPSSLTETFLQDWFKKTDIPIGEKRLPEVEQQRSRSPSEHNHPRSRSGTTSDTSMGSQGLFISNSSGVALSGARNREGASASPKPSVSRGDPSVENKSSSPVEKQTSPRGIPGRGSPLATAPEQGEENGDEAPPPPPHKHLQPERSKKPSMFAAVKSAFNNRRTSSPLKHEYQLSQAVLSSPSGSDAESDDDGESSDSSEEELEAIGPPATLPITNGTRTRVVPAGSTTHSQKSNRAPAAELLRSSEGRDRTASRLEQLKLYAHISYWSSKGTWVDLHPDEVSVVVGPGLIKAFPRYPGRQVSADQFSDTGNQPRRPLVALELTPVVPLRQSNAVDIEIRSPPTAESTAKCSQTIRFRSRSQQDCSTLYAAIHKARLENPVYIKLEEERRVSMYGTQPLQQSADGARRRSWFGRSNSYRASARAPSVAVTDNSSNSIASAISRLKGMGRIGSFNIARSSIDASRRVNLQTDSGTTSLYTDSSYSAASRSTPPGTPSSPSTAITGSSNRAYLGSSDLRVRLYRLETSSKWAELGNAFLTISQPPHGMRPASSLFNGIEKRIVVTKRPRQKNKDLTPKDSKSGSPQNEEAEAPHVLLDVVLGAQCFSRLGVVGIALNVWEDIVGDNGQVGVIGAVGGVSGRTRKWLFQCASAAEATWVFALVGGGGR